MENRQPEITNKLRISTKQFSFVRKKIERNPLLEKCYKKTIKQYISNG